MLLDFQDNAGVCKTKVTSWVKQSCNNKKIILALNAESLFVFYKTRILQREESNSLSA